MRRVAILASSVAAVALASGAAGVDLPRSQHVNDGAASMKIGGKDSAKQAHPVEDDGADGSDHFMKKNDHQQHYMQHGGDFQAYMHQSKQAGGSPDDHKMYERHTKGLKEFGQKEDNKFMWKGGGSSSGADVDAKDSSHADESGVRAATANTTIDQKSARDALIQQYASQYIPRVQNTSDPDEMRDAFMKKYMEQIMPHLNNESDYNEWRDAFIKRYVDEQFSHVKDKRDANSWKNFFFKKYASSWWSADTDKDDGDSTASGSSVPWGTQSPRSGPTKRLRQRSDADEASSDSSARHGREVAQKLSSAASSSTVLHYARVGAPALLLAGLLAFKWHRSCAKEEEPEQSLYYLAA